MICYDSNKFLILLLGIMKFIVLSNNVIFCIFPSVLKFKPLFPPPVDFSHTYDI